MRKKLAFLSASMLVGLLWTSAAMGQDDYKRFEFFVGYSHNRVDVGPVEDFDPEDDIEFSDICGCDWRRGPEYRARLRSEESRNEHSITSASALA